MKRNISLWLLLLLSIYINAQTVDKKKYLLTTKTNTIGISTLSLIDPYLSPLFYSGLGIRYDHKASRFLSLENTRFSTQNKINFVGGLTINPTNTASMTYVGINLDKGLYYHFQQAKGLKLVAGGSWDIDFGYKMVARNINNPVNINLATNLNLSGAAKYDIQMPKRKLKLELAFQSPLLGCMFVPKSGASYYEMFDLWNLSGTTHFSSLHNKRGIQSTFSVDVPFNRTTLHLGVRYETIKYIANEMVFKRNEFSLLIGSKFDVATFAGRKKTAPSNFISTND